KGGFQMKTFQVLCICVVIAAPAWAQTVALKGRIQSQSTTEAVIRLESGALVTVPIADLASDAPDAASSGGSNLAKTPVSSSSVSSYDVRRQCAAEWPSDFQMRAFCEKKQQEALGNLQKRTMTSQDRQTIRRGCLGQWPTDYQMRNYCEEQQIKALGE